MSKLQLHAKCSLTCSVMEASGSWKLLLPALELALHTAPVGAKAFTWQVVLCQFERTCDHSVAFAKSSSQLLGYVNGLCDGNHKQTRWNSKDREQVRKNAMELPAALYAIMANNMSAFLDVAPTRSSNADSSPQLAETRTAAATHPRGQGGMAVGRCAPQHACHDCWRHWPHARRQCQLGRGSRKDCTFPDPATSKKQAPN